MLEESAKIMHHTPQWVLDKIQKIQAQQLTELDLTIDWSNKNKLQEMPPEILSLEFLTSLKVSRHEIKQIPEAIAFSFLLVKLPNNPNQICGTNILVTTQKSYLITLLLYH